MIIKTRKMIAVYSETHEDFIKKKLEMEKAVFNMTGKVVSIPLPKVVYLAAKTPIYIPNDYLLKIGGKKKKVL